MKVRKVMLRWVLLVPTIFVGIGVAAVATTPGCGGALAGRTGPGHASGKRLVKSNVRFGDYAGSGSCEPCHTRIAERFSRSPMHRMTREADAASFQGPFHDGSLRVKDDVATMRTVDGRRYLHLDSKERGRRLYRITKIIGGRYREDYVGIRVAGTGSRDRPLADPPTQLILPVSWVIGDAEWRYKGYSVQLPERPGLAAGPVWNKSCIFCHNTAPYLSGVFDDLAGARIGYQGAITSNLLPADRRLRFDVHDERGLARALAEEIDRLGGERPDLRMDSTDDLLRRAAHTTRERFRRPHLVELGIGCESCHGGSRQHVESPEVLPSYRPRSPLFSVETAQGPQSRASAINHTCARCHSVIFSRYPYTWEGGTRRRDPQGSTINSGEARNFLLGGCARAMSCTTCHDPHAEDDPEHLEWLATPAGNVTCTGCHQSLAGAQALRAHAHHDPGGAGGSCVGCHMPRKNAGLDYALTRYHRIGSPTDRARVERDRPLECALCHLDGTVEELTQKMEQWWGRSYDRSALRRLYGSDLSVTVLEATLARGLPHEQTAAIERLGHTGEPGHLDALVEQLDHQYPLIRYFARESLRRLTGDDLPVDMSLPGSELRAAGRAWLQARRSDEDTPGQP